LGSGKQQRASAAISQTDFAWVGQRA